MNDEVLILEPLKDEKVDTGYQPNFSWSDKDEQNRELQAWAQKSLARLTMKAMWLCPILQCYADWLRFLAMTKYS